MKKLLYITPVLMLIFWTACNQLESTTDYSSTPILPEVNYNYVPDDAPSWISSVITPTNPDSLLAFFGNNIKVTNEGAKLGRVLFYDKALSLNNSVSCGSCHQQRFAFADNKAFSKGLMPGDTKRNSLQIVNVLNTSNLFWDSRASDLKKMVLMPVQDHIEMGFENVNHLPKKLAQLDYYAPLFKEAFGNEEISTDKIANALTQFVKSMVSYSSKYDQFDDLGTGLSALELQGKELFFNELSCNSCHSGNTFSGTYNGAVANIGLDLVYQDKGAAGITQLQPFIDDFGIVDSLFFGDFFISGAFKIPTLRNIELTAPYMHDGRFNTLEEVVEHYATGIKPHTALDWRLTDFVNGQIEITEADKKALVAFMKTLTDERFVSAPRFSDPFVVR